jgi:hypothetical protein
MSSEVNVRVVFMVDVYDSLVDCTDTVFSSEVRDEAAAFAFDYVLSERFCRVSLVVAVTVHERTLTR